MAFQEFTLQKVLANALVPHSQTCRFAKQLSQYPGVFLASDTGVCLANELDTPEIRTAEVAR